MIKSMIISFDETDESFITAFFKRMKINAKPVAVLQPVKDDYPEETKDEKIQGIRDAFAEIKVHQLGEIQMQSAREFLEELRTEEKSKNLAII